MQFLISKRVQLTFSIGQQKGIGLKWPSSVLRMATRSIFLGILLLSRANESWSELFKLAMNNKVPRLFMSAMIVHGTSTRFFRQTMVFLMPSSGILLLCLVTGYW